jgi:hypothetical protein
MPARARALSRIDRARRCLAMRTNQGASALSSTEKLPRNRVPRQVICFTAISRQDPPEAEILPPGPANQRWLRPGGGGGTTLPGFAGGRAGGLKGGVNACAADESSMNATIAKRTDVFISPPQEGANTASLKSTAIQYSNRLNNTIVAPGFLGHFARRSETVSKWNSLAGLRFHVADRPAASLENSRTQQAPPAPTTKWWACIKTDQANCEKTVWELDEAEKNQYMG